MELKAFLFSLITIFGRDRGIALKVLFKET